jgi:hypothetical protein
MSDAKMNKSQLQRTLVQLNPDARFLVQGYHTGDFLGAVAICGLTGAEFVIERTFSPTQFAPKIGDRIWVPFANYITLTLDKGEKE